MCKIVPCNVSYRENAHLYGWFYNQGTLQKKATLWFIWRITDHFHQNLLSLYIGPHLVYLQPRRFCSKLLINGWKMCLSVILGKNRRFVYFWCIFEQIDFPHQSWQSNTKYFQVTIDSCALDIWNFKRLSHLYLLYCHVKIGCQFPSKKVLSETCLLKHK